MGFCPFFSSNCPKDESCEIWDSGVSMCGMKRQKSLLELINLKGDDNIASAPPQGKYKIVNLFVDINGKLSVEYDDTPQE